VVAFVVAESDAAVSVPVRDSGPGIPDEAPELFQHFTHRDDPKTRRHGGTDLGLSDAKRFTKLINARIELASRLGRGNVFTGVLLNGDRGKSVEL